MHKGSVPYGSLGCTYHQLKYSSPNRSNKTKTATQKSLPFRKLRFREKHQENRPKAEKDKTEIAARLGRRTKKGI